MSYDVIIIGASLAGASMAIRLARSGARVALIDAAVFPRAKACGEGFAASALPELDDLGVVLPRASAQLKTIQFFRGGERAKLPLPGRSDFRVIGIQRRDLDQALLESLPSSVDLICGKPVRSLALDPGGLRCAVGASELSAPFAAIADGSRSPSARLLGVGATSLPGRRIGLTVRLAAELPPIVRDYVSIMVEPEGEIYLTPLGRDMLNASYLTASRRGAEELALKISRALEREFGLRAEQSGPAQGSGPFGGARPATAGARVLLAGDALECFDPIGGIGMSHALISGRLAAEALGRLLQGEDARKVLRSYERERESTARELRGFTRITSMTVSLLRRAPFLLPAMASRPAGAMADACKAERHASQTISGLVLRGAGRL